jgi:hypothetical protein
MAKINLYLTGNNSFPEVIINFKFELLSLGGSIISVVENKDEANLIVDISEMTPTTNARDEAIWVLSTANELQLYEKKRKRIIKKAVDGFLLASSNEEKAHNRKNIN